MPTKPKSVKLVQLKMVREKSAKYDESVTCSQALVDMITPFYKDQYREIFMVIGLNINHVPTVLHTVSVGGVSSAPVQIGNILKPLLLSNSSACICCHNHPGSTLEASYSDKELTKTISEATKLLQIKLLDHIILNVDCSEHYSMRSNGDF